MKSQDHTKTSQTAKPDISQPSEDLTDSEMKSLMKDFYETAKADKLPNAEDFLKIEDSEVALMQEKERIKKLAEEAEKRLIKKRERPQAK